jgi:archaemetzincin
MVKHPFLGLAALGPVDPDILQRLRTKLAKILKLPVLVLPPHPLPAQTYHLTRQQYNSTQLLEFLIDHDDSKALRILGVTAGDLYIPILTFVFGEAQVNGKAAIISLCRPRGDADGTSTPRPLLLDRLVKLSLHELGHTFGLGHCREEGCLMRFSSNLEKLDRTVIALCDYCRILLADAFLEQGLLPPFKQYGETHEPDASTLTGDSSRKRRQ